MTYILKMRHKCPTTFTFWPLVHACETTKTKYYIANTAGTCIICVCLCVCDYIFVCVYYTCLSPSHL